MTTKVTSDALAFITEYNCAVINSYRAVNEQVNFSSEVANTKQLKLARKLLVYLVGRPAADEITDQQLSESL